ncbi:MAG: Asp-tRNA(Asn)/Glu-tRNA(Gln) amidotransferase GatCAB subunit A, partial [Acidimicrobiia bacterium]|nr:Asp-tRNA(Asn)/Glu-tRNA(Gln) amidotransferase GatCAB subunit A [Acidimicrobiia bacterium]
MSDLADLTLAEASRGLRAREFTSVELLEAVHRRAAMTEANLHAYLTLDRDGAARAAVAADSAFKAGTDLGPLQGVPVALKDNMVTR